MQLTQLAQAGAFAQLPAAARAKLAQERPLMAPLPLPLPPPMVPGNYEANATSCHLQARLCCGSVADSSARWKQTRY
jgi:hypothetical protein